MTDAISIEQLRHNKRAGYAKSGKMMGYMALGYVFHYCPCDPNGIDEFWERGNKKNVYHPIGQ